MDVESRIQIAVAIIAAATTVSTTLISVFFSRQQKQNERSAVKEKQLSEEYSAIANGVKAILWILLEYMYKDAMSNGYISIDDLKLVDSVYKEYHTLGGNGTGTSIYQKLHALPNERTN